MIECEAFVSSVKKRVYTVEMIPGAMDRINRLKEDLKTKRLKKSREQIEAN